MSVFTMDTGLQVSGLVLSLSELGIKVSYDKLGSAPSFSGRDYVQLLLILLKHLEKVSSEHLGLEISLWGVFQLQIQFP